MIKLLIGGSPCTYWSIAQKNNRETEAEGMGWELFKNYLIAKEKFKPDFFLYENNKSAAQAIKDQIKHELGVSNNEEQLEGQMNFFEQDSGARYIEINSALVSAQNRQRFYVHNCGDVQQPEDRGILLKDILETGNPLNGSKDKGCALTATYYKGDSPDGVIEKAQRTMVAEPINVTEEGKAHCIKAQYYKNGVANFITNEGFDASAVAEPLECYELDPTSLRDGERRIGRIVSNDKNKEQDSQQCRVYNVDGKSVTLCGSNGSMGKQTGLYAVPAMQVNEATSKGYTEIDAGDCVDLGQIGSKTNCLTTSDEYYEYCGTKDMPIYEVKDGQITIKGKQYPIKLVDGYYIIRKLTVKECCRLQTMPDDYCRAVSNSRAYAGLGNGWTAEIIIHILNGALKDVPRDEEIVVLSMYDGIGTGRYCLDKMGFTNVKYYAYEIDKYAMQVSQSNYPDIVYLGDAFQLRDSEWESNFEEVRRINEQKEECC